MSALRLPARPRAPRRARYLIPPGTAHRREIVAALSLLALLAGLSLAQVTLGLALAFHVTGKLSRWRPAWLAVPAVAGLAWILIIGPAAAVDGLTAAPRMVLAVLSHPLPDLARLPQLGRAPAWPGRWFPGQFPAGLLLAAGLAAAAWWLCWLHTDEWRLPALRAGLLVTGRRWLTAAFIRSGGVLSRTGTSLGVIPATGRPAVISWPEAGHGVLVTGAAQAAVAGPATQLVHAAIRLRKPVIVVDLSADPALPALLAAMCAAAGAPLLSFTAAGPGCYEPFPAGDPARNAALAMGLVDWSGLPDPAPAIARPALADVFAVAAAAPADDRRAVLDDVVALLHPGALLARMDQVPGYWPGRTGLASRVAASAAGLAANPAAAGALAAQLAGVRASALGRWLGGAPPENGQLISLPSVIRQRAAVLFSLDWATYGPVAGIIAGLVARDVAASFGGLRRAGLGGDGLAWFSQCETADLPALSALIAAGPGAGLVTVLSTTSAAAAGGLAGQAGVLIVHRLADATLAGQLSGLTGQQLRPAGTAAAGPLAAAPPLPAPPTAAPAGAGWGPVVTAGAMCTLAAGEFVLIRRGSPDGVVPRAVSVPARIRGRPRPAADGRPQPAGHPADWPAGHTGRAGPRGRPAGRPPPAGPPGHAQPGNPRAGPGMPPWPNAPAWARGKLPGDQPR